MKILFVSMHSIHASRWIENLKGTDHELYWFDILSRGEFKGIKNVFQFINWKKRKVTYLKGEYFLANKFPGFYNVISPFLETTVSEALEKIIHKVKPDVIHSFEMQSCSYPLIKIMNKFPEIKWIYSCWGSDLYYYKDKKEHIDKIKAVLNRVDYLHTDCERDFTIAKELGFKKQHTGVVPGGGGFDIRKYEKYREPVEDRKIILVKGYEHKFGRALNVVRALESIVGLLNDYKIVVFGAHKMVANYIEKKQLPFECMEQRYEQVELLKLMGSSLIYIGNSISDGMPNTLIEAIIMGCYPIQSNPGGVSQEVITLNINGSLIEDPLDIEDIVEQVKEVILNKKLLRTAYNFNLILAEEKFEKQIVKEKIIQLYANIG